MMPRHLHRAALLSALILAACKDTTAPTTGTITLDVVTTGTDIDANGYLFSVDGAAPQSISANGAASWSGGAGPHTIAVTGLAFNCDLVAPPAPATVTLGETTHIRADVSCSPYLRNTIVYTSDAYGLGEVMVMRADGSRRERLTSDQAVYAAPVISPDGQSIAVASRLGGSWSGIYLLDRFGASRTRLVGRSTFDGSPAWSPNGTQLAFRSQFAGPYGDYSRIFVVARDGTGLRQLTPDVAATDYVTDDAPSWSPDGARVVFSRSGVLWTINADGSGATSLGINGMYPSWSPDGRQIAFVWYANQIMAIFVADANGTNVRQLTVPVEGDQNPRWSPDGRRIVFQRVERGVFHLHVMAADGTGDTMISTVPESESYPSFAPSF